MILDVVNSQEQLDPITQSYGNPLEADIVVCLVQFINEKAKVPFNRKIRIIYFQLKYFNYFRNWYYYTV